MREFMDEDFLLTTDTARELFHGTAEKLPIIDYHCHLNPREIAENRRFENVAQLMLGGDHYKWRAMMAYGIDEEFIRGEGSDKEKFLAYARMLPCAIGNPLYAWTHLELKRVFGIEEQLNEGTAPDIWEKCNALLAGDDFRVQKLIDRFSVETLCTTDDPADDLSFHRAIAEQGTLRARVLPAFRPDKALHPENPGFAAYIEQLSRAAGMKIASTDDVAAALERRINYFHAMGARLSDHGLSRVPYAEPDYRQADKAFSAAMAGEPIKKKHLESYQTLLLSALGGMYAQRGWTQQYHMSAMRDNNTDMFKRFGADCGFDSISDEPVARKLSRLLDLQDRNGQLPKTILYCLNPAENAVIASMLGNFQQSRVPGKIQMGSAWWFQDSRPGMEEQLRTLSSMGLLGKFVGMLTDSRSFISYPRHEYFRRILCNLLGSWVENGEYPADMETLKALTKGICYENAKAYFAF